MAWHGMAWSGMAWHRLYYTYKEILNALNSKGRCKDVILLILMLIYNEQPKGFEIRKNKVCKLKKSIYGLKQAGKL